MQESYDELRYKTSWPTRSQVVKSALIVLVAAAIIALVVLVMDLFSKYLMNGLYNLNNLGSIFK